MKPVHSILVVTAWTIFIAWGNAQEAKLPLHAEDLKVLQKIAELEKLDAPPQINPPGWPSLKGEMTVRFLAKDNPKHALTVAHNQDGRVTQLVGNGPLLRNDALRLIAALPELRIIRIDHNIPHPGSNTPHELYDGSGYTALKNSKLEQVRIGHAFDDNGMKALASIISLKKVDIGHSKASDAGIAHLAKHPNLEEVAFSSQARPYRITNKTVAVLASLPKLKAFALRETFVTYDDGLKHLAPLRGRLTRASFKGSLVLPADLAKFKSDHPGIQVETSTSEEILASPNSRGLLKWASRAGIEHLKAAEKK